ncbi:MAG: hypothetical protein WDZ79_01510 [Candidatus Paceibacterota bacterium]
MAYKTTTDRDEIRAWIEEYGGEPAVVAGSTTEEGSELLRVNFTGDSAYRTIEWEEFFDRLESRGLAFSYNNDGIEGSPEENFKIVDRNSAVDGSEDQTELPDAGDQEMTEGNMYSSEPEDHEPKPDEEESELLS